MGSWGYEVWQNDDAMDTIGNLHDNLVSAMAQATFEKNANNLFALLEIYFTLPKLDYNAQDTWNEYVPKLMSLTKDDGWCDPAVRIDIVTHHIHKWRELLLPKEEPKGLFDSLTPEQESILKQFRNMVKSL